MTQFVRAIAQQIQHHWVRLMLRSGQIFRQHVSSIRPKARSRIRECEIQMELDTNSFRTGRLLVSPPRIVAREQLQFMIRPDIKKVEIVRLSGTLTGSRNSTQPAKY